MFFILKSLNMENLSLAIISQFHYPIQLKYSWKLMVVKNVTKINSTLAARKFNNNKKKNDFEGEKIHTNYFSGIPVIPSASEDC